MPRLIRNTRIGASWIACGWRLFLRNPWLLGGMGACASLLLMLLWTIPVMGAPLVALLAPTILASFYLAIDRVSQLSHGLPAILRVPALKQSPRELFRVFYDERRLLPMVVVSLYCVFLGLVVSIAVRSIAGADWNASWAGLSVRGGVSVSAAIALALVLYFLLAASLVYALPRTFLRGKPLFPEMLRSIRAGLHYLSALALVLGVLLLPIVVGALLLPVSVWIAYVMVFVTGALALPLTACGLYCSYRTVYRPKPPIAAHA